MIVYVIAILSNFEHFLQDKMVWLLSYNAFLQFYEVTQHSPNVLGDHKEKKSDTIKLRHLVFFIFFQKFHLSILVQKVKNGEKQHHAETTCSGNIDHISEIVDRYLR